MLELGSAQANHDIKQQNQFMRKVWLVVQEL